MKMGISSAVVRLISSSRDLCRHTREKEVRVKNAGDRKKRTHLNMSLEKAVTAGQQQISLYLCHVCKGKVGFGVFLVVLDNFKKLCLPLHSHSELDIVARIVVEGEGQDESLSIGVVYIWVEQDG